MSRLVALFDACVLYPAPLRDLLMHLATSGLLDAKWTETIHAEWIDNLLAARSDLTRKQLEWTRQRMNAAVPAAVITGFEHLIPTLILPDPDDRHVLAAAIHAGANTIVTFNLRDFPNDMLSSFGIQAIHPDEFVFRILTASPAEVCGAVKRQRKSLKNPPKTVEELLATYEAQGLPQTVAALRPLQDLL